MVAQLGEQQYKKNTVSLFTGGDLKGEFMRLSLSEGAAIFASMAEAARAYEQIIMLPNCLSCKKAECEYKPKDREPNRFNCPLWEDGNGEK